METQLKECTANEQLIRKTLDMLEFDVSCNGYEYLVEIIKLGLDDINNIIPITQMGYPNIARIFETESSKVERAIRNVIKTAKGEYKVWDQVVGNHSFYSTSEGKPTNLEFIISIIEYLDSIKSNKEQKSIEINNNNSDECVRKVLKKLGFSVQIVGYKYLVEIIKLGLDNINNIMPITQNGYPKVARVFGTTQMNVEKTIRNAIETAIIYGDLETWNCIFENSYSALKGKPTNMEFIITLVDYIKFLNKKQITENTDVDIESIGNTLKLLCISTKIKGYMYLIEIIKFGINDFNNEHFLKEGYISISKKLNTTIPNIKRGICFAVQQSNDLVEFVDSEVWNKIFRNSQLKGKITSNEFIKALVRFFVNIQNSDS